MGHYTIWAVADEPSPESLMEMLEPYDEENDIPGDWPGMSFDYCEVREAATAGELAKRLREGEKEIPDTLVSPKGQMRLDCEKVEETDHDMPAVVKGDLEELILELDEYAEKTAYVMDWHA